MSKYLFNKIELDGDNVKFIPFRKASSIESFLANCHLEFDQTKWEFKPYSFKSFLKMLSKTKLSESGSYNITTGPIIYHWSDIWEEYEVTFDELLKHFASYVYAEDDPNENDLKKFYTEAYQIKENSQRKQNTLNQEPTELLK